MAEAPHRIAFHAWIQWCFDLQLAAASAEVRRIADMPVGVDPGGFDAWDWQDHLALDASVGVPADRFSVTGQDWGMPPFIPHRLREAGYEPFIETIRAQLRHAGGLRIDHVLGLFRLWWVPKGMIDGAYVHYPTDELLEIVAIESHRAGAIVIGEDLGTVPAGVRRELRRRRMLSTRLALFERDPPARYPGQTFAGVTTHDLPTVAGAVTGSDLDDQAASGVQPDPEGLAKLRARLLAAAGIEEDAGLEEVVLGLHAALAASPSALVAATLEDALRMERRPNLPGTVSAQRPNWSLPLPVPVEDLGGDVRVRSLIRVVGR
jgi:4-alpha-glucanotransferase